MAYFISLVLIACGLVIAIPAFLSWIDVVTSIGSGSLKYGDINQPFQQAKPIFTQFMTGGLISAIGSGLLIWKTVSSFASRNRSTPTISISNSSGVVLTLAERDAVVTSTIRELQRNNNNDIKTVANLLLDLKTAINSEPNLSYELKADALEQVKVIGEAAKETSEERRKGLVKSAIRVLKGIGTELPSAIQFIGACTKLLPQIASTLGLG